MACNHKDQINDVSPDTPQGCEECLQSGSEWVELRLCLTCGPVGCGNFSPNKHAQEHFEETGHPIVAS